MENGSKSVVAGAVMIAGIIGASAFRRDATSAVPSKPAASDALIRRVTVPAESAAVIEPRARLTGRIDGYSFGGGDARPQTRVAGEFKADAEYAVPASGEMDLDREPRFNRVQRAGGATAPPPVDAAESPARSPAPPSPPTRYPGDPFSATNVPRNRTMTMVGHGGPLAAPVELSDVPASARSAAGDSPLIEIRREARRHVVRDGDTLGGLAERYYGDPTRFREIFDANRAVLTSPDLLPIGAELAIPAAVQAATVESAAAPVSGVPAARIVPRLELRPYGDR